MIALFVHPALRKNPNSWLVVYSDAGYDPGSLRCIDYGEPLEGRRLSPMRFTVRKRYHMLAIGITPEWLRP